MFDTNLLKDIKLVVFDLDGTLVDNSGTVGQNSLKLIKQLQDLDVNISLASGRLHSAMVEVANILQIKIPIISLDGSLIQDLKGRNVIHQSFLSKKQVQKAIKFSEDYLVNLALCHSDAIYYTETNSVIPLLMDKYGALYKEVESYNNFTESTLEIVFASDNKRSVEYIRDKFSFPYAFGSSTAFFKSQTHDNIYYLEIRRSGSSKAKGFYRLLKYLRIKEKNTVVVGDWYNDIPLFETKALKVAMQNAVPELKRMASYQLKKTNDEDGTAEFLEALLKAKLDNQ